MNSNSERKLEICAGDIRSVLAAAEAGADRVELCSALSEGGLTPSAAFIEQAVKVGSPRVHVLIRPRPGDFLYNKYEVEQMESDVRRAVALGAHGVVIGALTAEGDIDMDICRRLMEAAGNASVTFHRAFDLCRDARKSLENVIALGCDRVLTSGLAPSAMDGAEILRLLVEQAAGRIIILPGGGVNPSNAAKLLELTGADELHASAREAYESKMRFRRDGIYMGAFGADEYKMKFTSARIVSELVKAIKN